MAALVNLEPSEDQSITVAMKTHGHSMSFAMGKHNSVVPLGQSEVQDQGQSSSRNPPILQMDHSIVGSQLPPEYMDNRRISQ
jgi:hypothetical protein